MAVYLNCTNNFLMLQCLLTHHFAMQHFNFLSSFLFLYLFLFYILAFGVWQVGLIARWYRTDQQQQKLNYEIESLVVAIVRVVECQKNKIKE